MGNRLHLAFKRQVPTEQARAYAERLGVTFFEVSPLCNFNITESFMELARIVLLRHGMDRLWRPSKGRYSSRLPGSPSSAQPPRTWPQVAVSILINQSFCPLALEALGMECPLVGVSMPHQTPLCCVGSSFLCLYFFLFSQLIAFVELNLPILVSSSHRRKGADNTCPISLRKRTRIRTRGLTFLSSCPCWRT